MLNPHDLHVYSVHIGTVQVLHNAAVPGLLNSKSETRDISLLLL